MEARQVLFCTCTRRNLIPAAVKDAILAGLSTARVRVTVVDDLCGLAANRDPRVPGLSTPSPSTIVACYPRAVRWLLHAAGVDTRIASPRVLNALVSNAETILKELSDGMPPSAPAGAGLMGRVSSPDDPWVPWFPVIDYDRCVNCRQCVSFCPFGVYSAGPDKVTVTSPRNCKDNCPACARVCPRQAIIFPKVSEVPINGAEVTEACAQAAGERLAAQAKELEKGDIHSVLAKRKLRIKTRPSVVSGATS